QAEDGIRDATVTGVQTCALPIWPERTARTHERARRHLRGRGAAAPGARAVAREDGRGHRGAYTRAPRPRAGRDQSVERPDGVREIGRASCRERVTTSASPTTAAR